MVYLGSIIVDIVFVSLHVFSYVPVIMVIQCVGGGTGDTTCHLRMTVMTEFDVVAKAIHTKLFWHKLTESLA